MSIRIRKVKYKAGKVHIRHEVPNRNGEWDEFSLNCADEPSASFKQALQDLASHALDLCELPGRYLDRLTVTSVSASYAGEKEVMGATITVMMRLDNSYQPLTLNTPYKASDSYTDDAGDPMQLLSEECIAALERLFEEAEGYLCGERAQLALPGMQTDAAQGTLTLSLPGHDPVTMSFEKLDKALDLMATMANMSPEDLASAYVRALDCGKEKLADIIATELQRRQERGVA